MPVMKSCNVPIANCSSLLVVATSERAWVAKTCSAMSAALAFATTLPWTTISSDVEDY
jgi:hypothetical protein